MFIRLVVSAIVFTVTCTSVQSACARDRNIQIKNPTYLNYGDGFFYIQGLSNGESVVMYKHPDDSRVFGQYTFKNEKCLFETVYYYVVDGKFEFTNPYITDETNFNITNKINFVKNGANYEIEYNVSPGGLQLFHNLGTQAERRVLPEPSIKKSPALRPAREIFPRFENIGKQNLKVSYLKNGENYIQFVTKRGQFLSLEGQYTFRTSDRKYHSVTYEVPLNDLDYSGVSVREYEVSAEENFFKTGTLELALNGTLMDVRYFVNSEGFHVSGLKRPAAPAPLTPVAQPLAPNPLNNQVNLPINIRPVRNQQPRNRQSFISRLLNPTFSRPDLLTGNRSVQPGK